jgi:hypothetical protein
MKMYGEMEAELHHSWPRHWIEVSGQLHASVALTPGTEPLVPLDRRLVWKSWSRKKTLPLPEIELCPSRSPSLHRLNYLASPWQISGVVSFPLCIWQEMLFEVPGYSEDSSWIYSGSTGEGLEMQRSARFKFVGIHDWHNIARSAAVTGFRVSTRLVFPYQPSVSFIVLFVNYVCQFPVGYLCMYSPTSN